MIVLKKLRRLAVLTAASLVLIAGPAFAAKEANPSRPLVINSDSGGDIQERIDYIEWLRFTRQPVEIRGMICLSSCTMYLGLPDVCVSKNTRFGFHGPSFNGKPLPPQMFEIWSQKMAAYYPEPIKAWFLKTARHEVKKAYYMDGTDLIRYGVKPCEGFRFAL